MAVLESPTDKLKADEAMEADANNSTMDSGDSDAVSAPLSGSGSVGNGGVKPLNSIGLSYRVDDYVPPSVKSSHDLKSTFRWESMLNETGFVAAPVSAYRHVSNSC